MSSFREKVSFVKGYAEGLNINTNTSEGKILVKIIELLDEAADEIQKLRKDHDELDEYVESMDDVLCDLEDIVFEDEDDWDEDDEDWEDDDDDEDDDGKVSYTCPHCGAEMVFEVDQIDFDEDYECPSCHKPLFPELPDDED